MKEEAAVVCRKCGVKHYMTEDGRGHTMPVFCCGKELKKSVGPETSRKALKKTDPAR